MKTANDMPDLPTPPSRRFPAGEPHPDECEREGIYSRCNIEALVQRIVEESNRYEDSASFN